MVAGLLGLSKGEAVSESKESFEVGVHDVWTKVYKHATYPLVFGTTPHVPEPPTPPTRRERMKAAVAAWWLEARFWIARQVCPEIRDWLEDDDE